MQAKHRRRESATTALTGNGSVSTTEVTPATAMIEDDEASQIDRQSQQVCAGGGRQAGLRVRWLATPVSDLGRCLRSSDEKYRHRTRADHVFRVATEDKTADTAAPVGAENDEVSGPAPGVLDDGFAGRRSDRLNPLGLRV